MDISTTNRDFKSPRSGVSRRGFSLIELTIVIVMIGIFASFVIFSSGMYAGPSRKIEYLARKVAGTMERAYQTSQTSGHLTRLVYDFEEQKMMLFVPRRLGEGEDPDDFDDEDDMRLVAGFRLGNPGNAENSPVWMVSVQSYDAKVFDNDSFEIDFRPTGTATGHVVYLESSNQDSISIEFNPLTGIAHIYYDQYKKVEEPLKD